MFGQKKAQNQQLLIEQNRKLTELQKTEREHEELEAFIAWLNKLCEEGGKQFCGIRKIGSKNPEFSRYIGFVLFSKTTTELNFSYLYEIHGYLSDDLTVAHPPYVAYVKQMVSEISSSVTNTLSIIDNQVKATTIRRQGVGSAGMDIIKELATHLRCGRITGSKRVFPDTPEDYAIRTAFYAKNGFSQDEDTAKIMFDMRNYGNRAQQRSDEAPEESTHEDPNALEIVQAEAFDQGIHAGIQTVAVHMLQTGKFTNKEIADVSGLCLEEVQNLKARLDRYEPITIKPHFVKTIV